MHCFLHTDACQFFAQPAPLETPIEVVRQTSWIQKERGGAAKVVVIDSGPNICLMTCDSGPPALFFVLLCCCSREKEWSNKEAFFQVRGTFMLRLWQ